MARFSKDIMKLFSHNVKIIQMLFYIHPVLMESDPAVFTNIKFCIRQPFYSARKHLLPNPFYIFLTYFLTKFWLKSFRFAANYILFST